MRLDDLSIIVDALEVPPSPDGIHAAETGVQRELVKVCRHYLRLWRCASVHLRTQSICLKGGSESLKECLW